MMSLDIPRRYESEPLVKVRTLKRIRIEFQDRASVELAKGYTYEFIEWVALKLIRKAQGQIVVVDDSLSVEGLRWAQGMAIWQGLPKFKHPGPREERRVKLMAEIDRQVACGNVEAFEAAVQRLQTLMTP